MNIPKKILAIDVGNTLIKYGLFEDGKLTATMSHATSLANPWVDQVLTQHDAPVALSSVVPSATTIIKDWCTAHNRQLFEVTAQNQKVLTGAPAELGSDLLAAAFAALKLYGAGSGIAVVGLGTASTLTVVSSDSRLLGVQITLGLGTTVETLAARCALLPGVTEDLKEVSLGLDTKSAVLNGSLLAHVGIVEAWIARARASVGTPLIAVGTGGWSSTVAAHTKAFDHVDPLLTLKGIFLLAQEAGFGV